MYSVLEPDSNDEMIWVDSAGPILFSFVFKSGILFRFGFKKLIMMDLDVKNLDSHTFDYFHLNQNHMSSGQSLKLVTPISTRKCT